MENILKWKGLKNCKDGHNQPMVKMTVVIDKTIRQKTVMIMMRIQEDSRICVMIKKRIQEKLLNLCTVRGQTVR